MTKEEIVTILKEHKDNSDYFLLFDFKEELKSFFRTKVDVVRLRDKMNESLKRRTKKDAIYV